MVNYEPELMYALDSKSEYADWKNVYNVSGSDVLYCPICLGRVKLWNGQDPNKTYQKQRCFHHIDGMCSQESRIHFAYKTWLLEKGSKFKVGETIYEVANSEIEKILHTKFGDYRPDITVETTEGKSFYIEIADTNKKTDDYMEKWDELGCDVLELDVNEQLIKTTTAEIPVFNIIYSSTTGECYIKHYTRQDYDDLITERKIYWKRKDLIRYKIHWERLDWFWRKLQDFYSGTSKIDVLIEAFKRMNSEDQRFVCKRMRGKHTSLRYELENNYTDKQDIETARLKHISLVIKKLNKEFGYTSYNKTDDTYLFRKNRHVIFKDDSYWGNRSHLYISDKISEKDVYDYFYPIMKKYYNEYTTPLREKIKQEKEAKDQNVEYFNCEIKPYLNELKNKINNCKNKLWYMDYSFSSTTKRVFFEINIMLIGNWKDSFTFTVNSEKDLLLEKNRIDTTVKGHMIKLFERGKQGDIFCRILESEER